MVSTGLRAFAFAAIAGTLVLAGCKSSASTDETAAQDKITSNVGVYPPAPTVTNRPRVGVPPFQVKNGRGGMEASLDDIAADQATTLMDQWGGFKMIERAQMEQIFKEQNLPGIAPGEAPAINKIHGVDLILVGKITNLSIKRTHTRSGFQLPVPGGYGQSSTETKLTSACGVDLRLVNPSTGDIACSTFTDYNSTVSASSTGISVMGVHNEGESDVELSDDDKGKLLRLALDDAIRKAIPKFERVVTEFNAQPAPPAAAN